MVDTPAKSKPFIYFGLDMKAPFLVTICTLLMAGAWLPGSAEADWLDKLKSATSNTLDVIKDGKDVVTGARRLKGEANVLVQQLEYNDTYSINQSQVLQLQTKLNKLGYEVGAIDGQLGGRTRVAIKEFQEDNQLAIDGAISELLVRLVKRSNQRAAPRLTFGSEQWIEVQTQLNIAGFDVGKPDGIAGKRTYSAMNRYIEANELQRIAHSELLLLNHLKATNLSSQVPSAQIDERVQSSITIDDSAQSRLPATASTTTRSEQSLPVVEQVAQTSVTPSSTLTALSFDCSSNPDPVSQGQCQMMQLFYQSQQSQYDVLLSRLKPDQRPGFTSLQQAWQDGIQVQCLDDKQCALMSMQERTAVLAGLYNPAAMDAYLKTAPPVVSSDNKGSAGDTVTLSLSNEVVPLESFKFNCDAEIDATAKSFCETASTLYDKSIRHCAQAIECETEIFLQQYNLFSNLYKSPRLSAYRTAIEKNEQARSARALSSVSSAADSTTSIFGLWYGNLTCSIRRKTHEMEVEILLKRPEAGVFGLQLIANNANSMSSGTSEVLYVGEPTQNKQGEIRFVPVKTVRGALSGMQLSAFSFDTVNGSIIFDEQGCDPLKLGLQSDNSDRISPSISYQNVDGAYWTASTTRDRCEVLVKWADRVNKEYPGRDFYRQNKKGDDWKKIKLFGDDDFIPVFGMPFDRLPLDKRKGINNFATGACRKDPFTQSRMTTYAAVADRVMPGSPVRQLTSDGYSSTLFAIRKIRSVRNQLARISRGNSSDNESESSFAEQESRLLDLRSIVADQAGVLWPSESKNVDAKINAHLSSLARNQAKKLLDEILFADDTQNGLELSFTGSTPESIHPFLKYLSESDKSTILKRLLRYNTEFAERITDPLLMQVEQLPNTVKGLLGVKSAAQEPLQHESFINVEHKKKVDDSLTQLITDRLDALVSASVSQLSNFEGNRVGVRASSEWKLNFDEQFREFSDTSTIKKADLAYRTHRSDLLEKAFAQFELDILSTKTEQDVVALLGDYLSWEDDGELPIALEYEFTAELAK